MKKYVILLLVVTTIFAKKNKDFVFPENITVSENKNEIIGIYENKLNSNQIYDKILNYLNKINTQESQLVDDFSIGFIVTNYSIADDRGEKKIISGSGKTMVLDQSNYYRDLTFEFHCSVLDDYYEIKFKNFQTSNLGSFAAITKKQKLYIKALNKMWNKSIGPNFLSIFKKLNIYLNRERKMTKEQALEKLEEAKKFLDLELISKEEYDALKKELTPIIIK